MRDALELAIAFVCAGTFLQLFFLVWRMGRIAEAIEKLGRQRELDGMDSVEREIFLRERGER